MTHQNIEGYSILSLYASCTRANAFNSWDVLWRTDLVNCT